MDEFGMIALLLAFIGALLWLTIGWRAMIAHERIAGALEEIARRHGRDIR